MKLKSRKPYFSPVLTSVLIDREITLVMASVDDPGGGPRAPANAAASNSDLKTNSFERSPFNDANSK